LSGKEVREVVRVIKVEEEVKEVIRVIKG